MKNTINETQLISIIKEAINNNEPQMVSGGGYPNGGNPNDRNPNGKDPALIACKELEIALDQIEDLMNSSEDYKYDLSIIYRKVINAYKQINKLK